MTVADLSSTFGNCKKNSTSCQIKSSFESYNSTVFYVRDQGDQLPVAVCSESESELEIINTSEEEIYLVKMDSCLIPDTISKCDCLVFNSKKLFLVEMKASSSGQRSNARKNAAIQLTSTLDLLLNNGVVIGQDTIQAIICFKAGKTYPVRASSNSMRANIYQQYRVMLDEGNQISF
jgi:hypothetical protein